MLRREQFRQLRAEEGEGRHPGQSGEMAGPRIVADKAVCGRKRIEQDVEVAQAVVEEGHTPTGVPQTRGQSFEPFPRPLADRVTGAGMDDNMPPGARGRRRCLKLPSKAGGQCPPVSRPMRL